ncbi:GNAT family N-acetyltransferase [Amycolatopsis anabasis]|uniref:GNAT family N-acetyltransferase n=1 Tax=Amycolatopsis anabasis TaxID=1840409 RepID=UPI00131E5415|nr:GNAT family N-acetyltransferase [Amycolatopsis anabasis]
MTAPGADHRPPAVREPVRLIPMSEDEFADYRTHTITSYADDRVRAGTWTAGRARQRAADEFAALLPEGLSTRGHHFYTAYRGGHRIGMTWFGEDPSGRERVAWIYDLHVDERFRGQGEGAAIMRALEDEIRTAGMDTVYARTLGDNTAARSLTRKLGYRESSVTLAKRLPMPHPEARTSVSPEHRHTYTAE